MSILNVFFSVGLYTIRKIKFARAQVKVFWNDQENFRLKLEGQQENTIRFSSFVVLLKFYISTLVLAAFFYGLEHLKIVEKVQWNFLVLSIKVKSLIHKCFL